MQTLGERGNFSKTKHAKSTKQIIPVTSKQNNEESHTLTFGADEKSKQRNSRRISSLKKRATLLNGHRSESASESLLRWDRKRTLVSSIASVSMQLLLLLHTPISRKVFQYFDCRDVGVGNFSKSFLCVDYSVQCKEGADFVSSWLLFLPLVLVVLCGFTLLLPLSLSMFLLVKGNKLYSPNILSTMGWMYERLHRGTEFWEIHELLRKMLLTGVIVFLPPDPAIRSSFCLIICIVAQCSLSYLQPHRSRAVFWAEELVFALTMCMYLSSVVLQAQISEDANTLVGDFFVGAFIIIFFCLAFFGFSIFKKLWTSFTDEAHLFEGQVAEQQHRKKLHKQKLDSILMTNVAKLKKNAHEDVANNVFRKHIDSKINFEGSIKERQSNSRDRLYARIQSKISPFTSTEKNGRTKTRAGVGGTLENVSENVSEKGLGDGGKSIETMETLERFIFGSDDSSNSEDESFN
jgi:hypothetical protein